MTKKRDEELERLESWDYERPEVRQPVKASRTVVSVAFQVDEFAQVSEYAERVRKRISVFIREASLEKAMGSETSSLAYITGGTGNLWTAGQMHTISQVSGSQVEQPDEIVATTY